MSKKPKRPRLYDIVTGTRVPSQRDPLNQLMEEEARDLASEARRLRLEEIIENRKRKLSRARQGSPIVGDDSNQLLNLMNLMNKQLETGVKIASSQRGDSKPDQTLEYLKFYHELMKTNQQSGMQPSFFDQYLRGREIGIFGQNNPGDSNPSDVEIERLRGERMLSGKKIDLEIHRLRLEQEAGAEKLNMIAAVFGPILALGGSKMAENARQMGVEAANRYRNPGGQSIETEILGSLLGKTAEMRIACPCGYDKIMIVPDPPPQRLNCPGCGSLLTTGASPVSDEETAKQWK